MCELDDATNEAVLLIHWTGGRHTEVRVPRVKTGRYPTDMAPTAVEALRKLAGHWPDRELAVSLNRMRCKTSDGETWTTVRVRETRERLGIAEYDPAKADGQMISLMKAAERLGICGGSAKSLVLRGILPATQIMPGSPWMVPVEALTSEAVRIRVQRVIDRRPSFYEQYQYDKAIRLPGRNLTGGGIMKRAVRLCSVPAQSPVSVERTRQQSDRAQSEGSRRKPRCPPPKPPPCCSGAARRLARHITRRSAD